MPSSPDHKAPIGELDVVRLEGTVLELLSEKYALIELADETGRGETVVVPLRFYWHLPNRNTEGGQSDVS